jgi:hypothetical protein
LLLRPQPKQLLLGLQEMRRHGWQRRQQGLLRLQPQLLQQLLGMPWEDPLPPLLLSLHLQQHREARQRRVPLLPLLLLVPLLQPSSSSCVSSSA